MIWTYETKQGDTWDMLALSIYGSERLAYVLIQANPNYKYTIVFSAGLRLFVPNTPSGKTNSPLPPWARG